MTKAIRRRRACRYRRRSRKVWIGPVTDARISSRVDRAPVSMRPLGSGTRLNSGIEKSPTRQRRSETTAATPGRYHEGRRSRARSDPRHIQREEKAAAEVSKAEPGGRDAVDFVFARDVRQKWVP